MQWNVHGLAWSMAWHNFKFNLKLKFKFQLVFDFGSSVPACQEWGYSTGHCTLFNINITTVEHWYYAGYLRPRPSPNFAFHYHNLWDYVQSALGGIENCDSYGNASDSRVIILNKNTPDSKYIEEWANKNKLYQFIIWL